MTPRQSNHVTRFVGRLGPSLYRKLNQRNIQNVDVIYDYMMHQLAHESDYGRSKAAVNQHNYGGYGWNGETYTTFNSDDEFLDSYLDIMQGRHKDALDAQNITQYAKSLKDTNYFEAPLEEYVGSLNGMKSLGRVLASHRADNPDLYTIPQVPQESELVQQLRASQWNPPIKPAYKNGKLPKFKDGLIPYEKDGVRYNINPNVVGAQQLNVTTPQVTVTGRDLTKPYFSSYAFNPTTFQQELQNFIKKRAYQSITPVGYDLPKAARELISGRRDYDYLSDAPMREALSAKYFDQARFKYAGGDGMVSDWITESPYQPSKGTATYGRTYRFNPEMFSYTPQEGKYESYLSDDKVRRYFRERALQGKDNVLFSDGASDLGPYTMGSGKDDKGHYISYYDDWDINFAEGDSAPEIARRLRKLFPSGDMLMGTLGTKPFTMYDRRYLTEDEWRRLGGYKNGKTPKLKYRQ